MARRIEYKPDMQRKRLDAAGVMAHFESVARAAQAIEIRTRAAATASSQAAVERPEEAGRRLVAGELVAVQLRFAQDGDWWCDTVMRVRDSFRLVRMRQGNGEPRP